MISMGQYGIVWHQQEHKQNKQPHTHTQNRTPQHAARIQAFQKEVALNFMDGFQGLKSQNSMNSGRISTGRNSTDTLNSVLSSDNSPKQRLSGAAKERIAKCGYKCRTIN